MYRLFITLWGLILFFSCASAQGDVDTLITKEWQPKYNLSLKNTVIPVVLIGYGFAGLYHPQLKDWNLDVRSEVLDHINREYNADDYFQCAPQLAVYFIDDAGIKAKHNFKDRTIVLLTSYIMMTTTVRVLKNVTHVMRPDSSTYTSFPSGHTAMAFTGAEFLWQEYKDKSVWYGVAGYTVAASIGIARVINNRHWINDVASGAGIGILSTKVAYIIHERVKHKIKIKREMDAMLIPYYNKDSWGVGLAVRF